jgi:hypothetical protein
VKGMVDKIIEKDVGKRRKDENTSIKMITRSMVIRLRLRKVERIILATITEN